MLSSFNMLSPAQIRELLQTIPPGYKRSDNEFFTPVNEFFLPKFKRLGVITTNADGGDNSDSALDTSADSMHGQSTEMYCNVPSCKRFFDSVAAYQSHFNSVHRYICAQCNKSLPTPHLLDLHISEQHDSYFAARVARGELMYECFLEECKQRLLTPALRKQHCVETHKFPGNFRFDQLPHPQQQHQERNQLGKKCKNSNAMDTTMMEEDQTTNKPKIHVYSFGHQKTKTFNAATGRQHKNTATTQKEGAMLNNLQHLKEALNDMS